MKGHLQTLALASALGLLAGCGTTRSVVVQPAASRGAPTYRPPSRTTPPPVDDAGSYRVEKGDTLYSIAFRHGKDFRDVARWNGISAPYTIWPGQVLLMHPSADAGKTRPVAVARVPARSPERTVAHLAPPHPPVPPATARSAPEPAQSDAVPVAGEAVAESPLPIAPAPPPASAAPPGGSRSVDGIRWRWPADGTVIKGFQSGDAIPGIEIAGHAGNPVRAAADGVVVYSGNGLVGYGELIIVKHNDDFLSAYGHNRKRMVKEGQRVSAGQVIAEMGATGASRDELQFQIRRNGNPVNPLDYLPSR
ncbi:MAG TPA: peptidoglycan DD-metalloendopeptidase family protein [Dyella sp.]|nr:peptidoglycan DD-metalloendopeptidase family protein [Dyella sp.]